MKKRMLALLLGLLCTGLTACGSTDTAAKDETPSAPTVEQPEPEPTPEEVRRTAAEQYADGLTPGGAGRADVLRARPRPTQALTAQYDIGGYLLFACDFDGQTKESVAIPSQPTRMPQKRPCSSARTRKAARSCASAPTRNLRGTKFQSPQALYREGGFDRITSDTFAEKDALLRDLGINVNFAPVCDVSTDPSDFIYARSFGIDAEQTGEYVRTVVTQMVSDKTGMVLKHFPGYGNNADTHTGIAIDERPMDTFRQSDFLPFQAGIESGAQSVLVSHNVVNCMDADRPASLSAEVHRILREELGFDGVILTDDLIMDAIRDYTGGENAAVLAVQAGNDMLTSSDFVTQYNAVLAAVQDGTIPESQIHASAVRVIDWKMQLGLISYDA